MTLPRVIANSEHGISRSRLSSGAVNVTRILKSAGFSAELVGGCIRDLLLGKNPKDFDVATSATPEQIQRLFRRCRVFGRRFRLAEVRIGAELIQIATYRSAPGSSSRFSRVRNISATGKILKDNNFGNIEKDAFRRDLTINALYLHPSDMKIFDYTDGFRDMQEGVIRVIGNAEHRYREDPVRMLRAIRFAASLEFKLDANTVQPVAELAVLLRDVSHSRLGDEFIKLFFNGHAYPTFQLLNEHAVFPILFPAYSDSRGIGVDDRAVHWLNLLFQDADQRVQRAEPLSMAYTMAAILWMPYLRAILERRRRSGNKNHRILPIAENMLTQQNQRIFISRMHGYRIQDIWQLQKRLENESPGRSKVVHDRSFRAALRLFELRANFGEVDAALCGKWVDLRTEMMERSQRRKDRSPRKRRSRGV